VHRKHVHPLLRHNITSKPHLLTDLTLDEASSAALVRMMMGCPQLTELALAGAFELLRLCAYYVL
jgi:hypothetical protein